MPELVFDQCSREVDQGLICQAGLRVGDILVGSPGELQDGEVPASSSFQSIFPTPQGLVGARIKRTPEYLVRAQRQQDGKELLATSPAGRLEYPRGNILVLSKQARRGGKVHLDGDSTYDHR